MTWLSILKKNDKEFEKTIVVEIEECIPEHVDIDNNIRDVDEEFENKYSIKIMDLRFEFKEYINELALPFLDGKDGENEFYDFIKDNCSNYEKVKKNVNMKNEEYINEIQEQNDEIIYDKKFTNFNCS
jgi:hypothetical protein